jgi:hypothetical protein
MLQTEHSFLIPAKHSAKADPRNENSIKAVNVPLGGCGNPVRHQSISSIDYHTA